MVLLLINLAVENKKQRPAIFSALRFFTLISPFILFASLGYISIQAWVHPQFPENHVIHFADSNKFEITGKICSSPEQYDEKQRFIIDAEALGGGNTHINATGKIRVTVYGKGDEFFFGDEVKFVSRIKSIRNFNNPGAFDYQRYMAFEKIWVMANTGPERIILLKRNHPQSGMAFIENYRNRIGSLIRQNVNGETAGVLSALVIGDKSDISQDVWDAFNRAGVSHILAISGLHIGIVAMVFFWMFQKIFSMSDFLLWNALVKRVAAVFTLFPVLVYGLLSGMSPSTQRAVIMVSVFLMTFFFNREHDSINTLALAALVILAVDPPSIFSISFQLSFISVFFIIYGLSWVNGFKGVNLTAEKYSVASKIMTSLMVSFFAFVGSLPFVIFYFNQFSAVGILANLFIIPFIGFGAVALGLSAVFLYPVHTILAIGCIKGSAYVIEKSFALVKFFSGLPFAAFKSITPTLLEMICFYLLIWAAVNLNKNRIVKYIALSVVVIFMADIAYWVHERYLHDDLRVTVIDVGQGSSALHGDSGRAGRAN